MKKIVSILALFASAFAFGATTSPVQLINPTGSTAGQAIVSTGSSSAPAWGNVALSGISSIAANTVVGNFTGSSAAPSAATIPSCSSTANVLQYTSGTGFSCLTTLFSSPTITTPNITGVTNGSNATGGSVGEFPAANTAGTSMSSTVAANCTALSLTAGDWDVWGNVVFSPAGGTVLTNIVSGITTTAATLPAAGSYAQVQGTLGTGTSQSLPAPMQRINVTSTTTVYLIGYASFTTSTMTCSGWMWARRVR